MLNRLSTTELGAQRPPGSVLAAAEAALVDLAPADLRGLGLDDGLTEGRPEVPWAPRPGTSASAPATEDDGDAPGLAGADSVPEAAAGEFWADVAPGFPPPEKAQASRPSTPRPATRVRTRRRQYVSGCSGYVSSSSGYISRSSG